MNVSKTKVEKFHLKTVYPECLFVHIILLLFFLHYGIYPLVWMNVGSIILYGTGTLIYAKMKNPTILVCLFYAEIELHMMLCNFILGWGMGFSVYGLVLVPYTFAVLYHTRQLQGFVRKGYLISAVCMGLLVASCFIQCQYKKVDAIPDYMVNVCFFTNIFICFISMLRMSSELLSMVAQKEIRLTEQNQELEHRANYDLLTGVLNRDGFFESVDRILHQPSHRKYYMVCSDIKNFKFINDLYGDEVGDQVLRTLAQLYMQWVKEDAVVGRIGGDKFALLIPKESMDEEQLLELTQDMQKRYSTKSYHFHMYLGVYEITQADEPIVQICDKAFIAVQKIKGDFHKVIAYYNEKILNDELEKQSMISEFANALKERQFQMYLQPQTDKDGNMLGAEALVRWQHPVYGWIMPNHFIECFEEAGIIYRMDRFIWEEAARKLQEWGQQGMLDYYISINISTRDFYYMDVYGAIQEIVASYGIEKEKLHIEITETAFAQQQEKVQNSIRKLYEAGYIIGIDDFGSGYSSFKFLKDVSANVLKIDREFLKETSNIKRGKEILNPSFT